MVWINLKNLLKFYWRSFSLVPSLLVDNLVIVYLWDNTHCNVVTSNVRVYSTQSSHCLPQHLPRGEFRLLYFVYSLKSRFISCQPTNVNMIMLCDSLARERFPRGIKRTKLPAILFYGLLSRYKVKAPHFLHPSLNAYNVYRAKVHRGKVVNYAPRISIKKRISPMHLL